ncbi:MAG: M15 family metallopeptidase [Halomonas sp.]|uniref:M15 family metallopeptidase n=1 Tax=Halomonas sp. TaxID=1486246 RepID=UPI002ACEC1A2|nr:M15 family metallopeptidase [Halomonas sp.]MDZ7853040.1 M15 family metallopeptidase [Halomonas sp.]
METSLNRSLSSPIDRHPEPDWPVVSRIPITGSDEPLVPLSLAPSPIKIFPVYARQAIPGAIDECYVREGVYRQLLKVARSLPTGYGLIVLDGWRPWRVQQYLFDTLQEAIRSHHPELGEEALLARTREFVSVPSREATSPSPHLTGGAVDLTLSDADGLPLDMGTLFDEAVPASHTAALEAIPHPDARQQQARDNRRRLYSAMREQGFTNLPSEWWHYDSGDQLWAHYGGHTQALYGPAELETIESRWRRQL